MALLYDIYGNPINNLHRLGNEAVIDSRVTSQVMAAANAEVFLDIDVQATAAIDFRGTFVLQAIAEITVDGTNYMQVPIWNAATELYIVAISASGVYQVNITAGTKRLRIRCSSFTSGSANVSLRGSNIDSFVFAKDIPASMATATAAAAAAITLTIPAAGVGLYNYLVALYIVKFNAAALTAAATPVLVTTTGIIGLPIFSFSAGIEAQGIVAEAALQPIKPVKGTALNTAMTIVCPATTGVIWRVNAVFYIGS